jgi:hypothetical protein
VAPRSVSFLVNRLVSMTNTSRPRATFLERYCEHHKLDPDAFVDHLLVDSLHAPFRWVAKMNVRWFTDYLEPDIACVSALGRLRGTREMESELAEFAYHPRNRTFIRRYFRQRLSTQRVRRILRQLPS